MLWRLHSVTIEGLSHNQEVAARWQAAFAATPAGEGAADLVFQLEQVEKMPAKPPGRARFVQGNLLRYYLRDEELIAHFPRFGQLRLALDAGRTTGQLLPAALHTYGVLEDLLAIGLSAHLRRRGLFLLHAFAAAWQGQAVLLVGGPGAGKTTTGMALLQAGFRLLSNDSPIVAPGGQVLSYPGLLAAYPATFARFPATAHLAAGQDPAQKLAVPAESVWPAVWQAQAPAGAILFPQIEPGGEHGLERLPVPETLRLLLPHAVERWDRAMMPAHLRVLAELAVAAPGFRLRLGPDVEALPALIASALPRTIIPWGERVAQDS